MRYTLKCKCGHTFQNWFRDSRAFEVSKAHGVLECPKCGSKEVDKALMSPSVRRSDTDRSVPEPLALKNTSENISKQSADDASLAATAKKRRDELRSLHRYLSSNAEWVGNRFAEVARARHQSASQNNLEDSPREPADKVVSKEQSVTRGGDTVSASSNARPIWGEATAAEAYDLWEEGICALPLPRDPNESN